MLKLPLPLWWTFTENQRDLKNGMHSDYHTLLLLRLNDAVFFQILIEKETGCKESKR